MVLEMLFRILINLLIFYPAKHVYVFSYVLPANTRPPVSVLDLYYFYLVYLIFALCFVITSVALLGKHGFG